MLHVRELGQLVDPAVQLAMRYGDIPAIAARMLASTDLAEVSRLAYFVNEDEVWARRYAQYVWNRSLASLAPYPASASMLWPPLEFDFVAQRIQGLFLDVGWEFL